MSRVQRYIYVIQKRRSDIYGNPRSRITVYRMKNNVPHRLNDPEVVGYRDDRQAAYDIIDREEGHSRGWAWNHKCYEGMEPTTSTTVLLREVK